MSMEEAEHTIAHSALGGLSYGDAEPQEAMAVADREELPDDGSRYEVIDGELFVTPSPAWRHQLAVGRLYRLLADYLDRERVGCAFIAPADVVFSPKRGVQPDLFVVPLVDGRPPNHFDEVRQLLLVAEVLSPNTARADRVVKRTLYRDEQVAEYWIVDLDSRTVERSTPSEARPEILERRVEWAPADASNPLAIDLEAYFAAVLNE
jgi:Uma2 family endonuclease